LLFSTANVRNPVALSFATAVKIPDNQKIPEMSIFGRILMYYGVLKQPGQRQKPADQTWTEGIESMQNDPINQQNCREASYEQWARQFEPTTNEISDWIAQEKARRKEWAEGPTEAEVDEYFRRTKWQRASRAASDPESDPLYSEFSTSDPWLRESDLAVKGAVAWLWSYPFRLWSSMVRTGYAFERSQYRAASRPNRIPYRDIS
jgi:hypothetical protein